jgi:hypothetical protein
MPEHGGAIARFGARDAAGDHASHGRMRQRKLQRRGLQRHGKLAA